MLARCTLSFLMVLLASCAGSPSGPSADLDVATDRSTYVVGNPILLSVQNTTEADAFFQHCDNRIGFVLQERSGADWVDSRGMDGPVCPAVYMSGVLVLIPGSAYERTFTIDRSGTYRARFETGARSTAIGSDVVYSNVFDVE